MICFCGMVSVSDNQIFPSFSQVFRVFSALHHIRSKYFILISRLKKLIEFGF